jgi:hypothetical protein
MNNKIFSGYQPRQMVEVTLKTRMEMVLETLIFFAIQPFDAAGGPRRFYYTFIPV